MKVRFEVPDWVSITNDAFDGARVRVVYNSSYGGDVTIEGRATIEENKLRRTRHLVVDGKKFANGYAFSDKDGRKVGRIEKVEAVLERQKAIDLVASGHEHDVDRGEDRTVVQGWDRGLIENEGFMEGTFSIPFLHED